MAFSPDSVCPVALTGGLLGYPTVYVLSDYDESGNSTSILTGNCLGGVPLTVVTLQATLANTEIQHPLESFSYPEAFTAEAKPALEAYVAQMALRIGRQTEFCSLTVSQKQNVSLDFVAV